MLPVWHVPVQHHRQTAELSNLPSDLASWYTDQQTDGVSRKRFRYMVVHACSVHSYTIKFI